MRILVCGGRTFSDAESVAAELESYSGSITALINGGAKGADAHALAWAAMRDVPIELYMPDWNRHDRSAGPIRNQRMIDEGKPDLVIAFPGGRGTADMVGRARKAGIEVREVDGAT